MVDYAITNGNIQVGYSITGQVTGGVGLHMCSNEGSILLFTNRTFASCGYLKVSSGIMEFARTHTGSTAQI